MGRAANRTRAGEDGAFLAEFRTVDLVLDSGASTSHVDAFSLAMIKCERQMRRLFTHLIFQFPCFRKEDVPALRETLAARSDVYFEGLKRGFDVLYPKPISELVGQDNFAELEATLHAALRLRNKIFHGQITGPGLSAADISRYVAGLREWAGRLSLGARDEFAYDGFGRNSFRKSRYHSLSDRFNVRFQGLDDYQSFIKKHLVRSRPPGRNAA